MLLKIVRWVYNGMLFGFFIGTYEIPEIVTHRINIHVHYCEILQSACALPMHVSMMEGFDCE